MYPNIVLKENDIFSIEKHRVVICKTFKDTYL